MTNHEQPAFPKNYAYLNPETGKAELKSESGMTLRQWYAGMALIGQLGSCSHGQTLELWKEHKETSKNYSEMFARNSFDMADAMIAYEKGEK